MINPMLTQQRSEILNSNILNVIDITRYSSYKKLLRVTAFVLKFVARCRRELEQNACSGLSVQNVYKAETLLIKHCQEMEFRNEITSLHSGQSKLPLVKQLSLFLNDRGILRCRGRIHNAPVDEDAKFPFLLPKKHVLTRLIIQETHARHLHAGVNATVTHLRQKFWVPAIRQCVQATLRQCVTCRRVSGRPYVAPDPPPLPKARVQDSAPFTVTGVDFTGALHIKQTTGSDMKAYICLFTCAATRAVHLEVVTSLSTESFLQAFRRFTSRKSLPKIMISDNATTFIAASRELMNLRYSTLVQDTLSNLGVEWRFIPQRAPWYGGWWERLIGLTKTTLKKILGRAYINLELLQTIVTEIESVINDRPLSHTSFAIDDPVPLTPAHLLYGRRITSLPHGGSSGLTDELGTPASHDPYTRYGLEDSAHRPAVLESLEERKPDGPS